MLFILQNVIFSSLQVHSPAVLPFIFFTRGIVKNMTGVAVLKAFNFIAFKHDGLLNFRSLTAILDLFRIPHCLQSVSGFSLPLSI